MILWEKIIGPRHITDYQLIKNLNKKYVRGKCEALIDFSYLLFRLIIIILFIIIRDNFHSWCNAISKHKPIHIIP